MTLNLKLVQAAAQETPWDLSNKVLYDLCHKHPTHTDEDEILAKILLIGRVYAAAIERRRKFLSIPNDDFYIKHVAPEIKASPIDGWLAAARNQKPGTPEATNLLIGIHGKTTALFKTISNLEKRSLASKYLHFHVPNLFYIYDSRAIQGIRKVSNLFGKPCPHTGSGDTEYAKFVAKCQLLTTYCKDEYDIKLKPRKLDNLLLALSVSTPAVHKSVSSKS